MQGRGFIQRAAQAKADDGVIVGERYADGEMIHQRDCPVVQWVAGNAAGNTNRFKENAT
ncbi:hypothetical protein [Stenotrophomonas sp. PE591]|uniref:hypothetical protein n=1 Tax=Stenotrophomonas sp. PE591 TaxID=1812490 RepID=UPI002015FDE6|nr:hypothetical protein [Stenotrophomonas sp. PE591]